MLHTGLDDEKTPCVLPRHIAEEENWAEAYRRISSGLDIPGVHSLTLVLGRTEEQLRLRKAPIQVAVPETPEGWRMIRGMLPTDLLLVTPQEPPPAPHAVRPHVSAGGLEQVPTPLPLPLDNSTGAMHCTRISVAHCLLCLVAGRLG